MGYSPIAMARNAVGMTLACEEYGSSFFANGARPGGVLKHPGVLKDPSKLRESWQAVYGGTANTGKVVVLCGRSAPWGLPEPDAGLFNRTSKRVALGE